MKHRLTIILDCPDARALAPFWAETLGYEAVWENEQYVVLVDPDKQGPVFGLQQVPEPKTVKNRMHIDLHTPDLDPEVERLERLGARRVGEGSLDEQTRWIILTDPAGNEFCVVSP